MTNRLWLIWFVLSMAVAAPAMAQAQRQLFDPMFSDHAVLQRGKPIRVWGTAAPGERVDITLDRDRVWARAGADGRWRATLRTRSAGGPYRMEARSASGRIQTLSDIAVGDVFLCSGQSNMEWPLSKSDGGAAEIANADDPSIRLATMPAVSSPRPVEHLAQPLAWRPATPVSAADFSAVCWYMARALQRSEKVPFGLIDASWGGSTLQAWLSPTALASGGGDREPMALLALLNQDPAAANRAWGERWERWWYDSVSTTERPWMDAGTVGWAPVPAMSLWEEWPTPVLAKFNGMVWYRTRVTVTAMQAGQSATLDVGAIDEMDQTWVNGRAVGTGDRDEPRRYVLPAGTLKAGDNVVTINILDTWEKGGPYGSAERRAITLADGTRIPLSDEWFYRKVDFNRPRPPRAPWHPAMGQGTLYNGMIAPLGGYNLRAMAWYQGESNPSDRLDYGKRLDALYRDRRSTFGSDLPILLVQLANYGPEAPTPVESDWASVREAQRRHALADKHSGLAVTIDVGNPNDIHPTNKRSVGERLARSALAVVYGAKLPRTGPQPISAVADKGRIIIRFADVTGSLTSSEGPLAFELCGETPTSCRRVPAKISAASALLPMQVGAARVRYCWADSPVCSLRDQAVPVSPFEIALR